MSGKVVVQPTTINFKNFQIELRISLFTHSNYDANADVLNQKLGWIKLDSQRLIYKVVMVYRSSNDLALNFFSSKFVDRSSVCIYSNLLFHCLILR